MHEIVWAIVGECGDYYCGCGVGHLIAITTDQDKATELVKLAEAAKHGWTATGQVTTDPEVAHYRSWIDVKIREVRLNDLYPYPGV